MEDIQYNMKRYEKKYFLTEAQYGRLLPLLEAHMQPDSYGNSEVYSLYYDTEDYAVIRSCLDYPLFKEKFRLRSYGSPRQEDLVFAELKKKYNGITYKCRVDLPLLRLSDFFSGFFSPDGNEQTVREIRWFMNRFDNLSPKVLISCYREPWEGSRDQNLRITLDRDIRCCPVSLGSVDSGREVPLSVPADIVMEIKTTDAVPLWMCGFLSRERIYCTSFSKYGTWYKTRAAART